MWGLRRFSTAPQRFRPLMSRMLLPTTTENPPDALLPSHRLLSKAGFVAQHGQGLYSMLPLGWRVYRKVLRVIEEELGEIGAQYMEMPAVVPASLWEKSGRLNALGSELLRFKDRRGSDMVLSPTHEEAVTDIVAHGVHSGRKLPLRLWQCGQKFRDENQPKHGLLRARAFHMKDLYTFDKDVSSAAATYLEVRDAYTRIFQRIGLGDHVVARADAGSIGGSQNEEFLMPCDAGESTVYRCSNPDCSEAHASETAAGTAPPPPGLAAKEWSYVDHTGERREYVFGDVFEFVCSRVHQSMSEGPSVGMDFSIEAMHKWLGWDSDDGKGSHNVLETDSPLMRDPIFLLSALSQITPEGEDVAYFRRRAAVQKALISHLPPGLCTNVPVRFEVFRLRSTAAVEEREAELLLQYQALVDQQQERHDDTDTQRLIDNMLLQWTQPPTADLDDEEREELAQTHGSPVDPDADEGEYDPSKPPKPRRVESDGRFLWEVDEEGGFSVLKDSVDGEREDLFLDFMEDLDPNLEGYEEAKVMAQELRRMVEAARQRKRDALEASPDGLDPDKSLGQIAEEEMEEDRLPQFSAEQRDELSKAAQRHRARSPLLFLAVPLHREIDVGKLQDELPDGLELASDQALSGSSLLAAMTAWFEDVDDEAELVVNDDGSVLVDAELPQDNASHLFSAMSFDQQKTMWERFQRGVPVPGNVYYDPECERDNIETLDHDIGSQLSFAEGATKAMLVMADESLVDFGALQQFVQRWELDPDGLLLQQHMRTASSTDSSVPEAVIADEESGADATHNPEVKPDIGMEGFFMEFAVNARVIRDGDMCGTCDRGFLYPQRAVEVGHVFNLGTTYSQPLEANFQRSDGTMRDMQMGCYGIGVSRVLATLAELCHDKEGLVWPDPVAPYRACIVPIGPEGHSNHQTALDLHDQMEATLGWHKDICIDDRPGVSPGAKLFDAALIGFPWVVVVGKRCATEGLVELQRRDFRVCRAALGSQLQDTLPQFIEQSEPNITWDYLQDGRASVRPTDSQGHCTPTVDVLEELSATKKNWVPLDQVAGVMQQYYQMN